MDEMENELDFISIISNGKQYGYNINEIKSIVDLEIHTTGGQRNDCKGLYGK